MMEILGETFVRNALAASVIVGGLCAFLGVYVVLKRIVLLGIALSEISALGVAAGLMLGVDPTAAALALTLVAVLIFWAPHRSISIPRESAIGLSYILAAALSIILIAKNPLAESRGLDLVSGNLLYVERSDIAVLGIVAAPVLALHLAAYRKFIFVSFDPETARASGIRTDIYDLLMYLSLGIAISISMKIVGVLFVFGSLVVPPLAGLMLVRRMPLIFVVAVIFACISSTAGVIVSFLLDWPTAPAIMAVSCALFVVVALVAFAARHRG